MLTLKVVFSDGDYLITRFNGTKQEAGTYYLDRNFNAGATADAMKKCIEIDFLEEEK